MRKFLLLVAFVLLAQPALAGKEPRPGPSDPRVRTVVYNERDVVELRGFIGFAMLVQFADYETITDFGVGDRLAWDIAANSAKNGLIIKPREVDSITNVLVQTNKRTYTFQLLAVGRVDAHGVPILPTGQTTPKDVVFRVEFQYPDDIAAAQLEASRVKSVAVSDVSDPNDWNMDYSYSGSEATKPVHVFDDGKFTFFSFPERATVPGIFSVDAEGNEALVSHHVRGKYFVVERVESQFTLRSGDYVTCIFNEAKPHAKTTGSKRRKPV